ncbi:hypothetical protein HELRODRAFT_184608 [Helobdella robusta]|uniref:Ribosomal protein/NADH dehydrogenase domain-containing protein n=1 Tax=Helobdella robusta TaxID=6412 RepID=T1FLK8_HELRO|nr:hypothetical protein HELRODRAFT_184608 [Helobdella robusta]ESO08708.1 hypothetical protein HELRODRAFT_184608 [Helobdella robusta]
MALGGMYASYNDSPSNFVRVMVLVEVPATNTILLFTVNGNEQKIPISDKSVEEICQWVEHLKNISGSSEHRLVKTWRTDTPSIQGVWTPYLNKNPKHNITDFPSDSPEFKHQPTEKSASQNLLERADQLRRLKA